MALKTIVKISNVTNLSDARYCAGMGVDMLGFSMDEHAPEYVDPKKFTEIRSWVAGVNIVGETTSTDINQIEQLLESYKPDMLQISDAILLPYLTTYSIPLILKVDLTRVTIEQLEVFASNRPAAADYLLFESQAPLHLDEPLSSVLTRLANQSPVILGAGINGENVHQLLADLPIQGIALTGGDEERPGNKEFGELMDILESLETE